MGPVDRTSSKEEKSAFKNAEDKAATVAKYAGLGAIIAAFFSTFITVNTKGNENREKVGKNCARVYVILEITAIVAVICVFALKVIPYAMARLR